MVLALLSLIRPLQPNPLWTVQKAAADRVEAAKAEAAKAAQPKAKTDTRKQPKSPPGWSMYF